MIYPTICCSSSGSLHRSHICFTGLSGNTCASHTHTQQLLVSFGLAFGLSGKNMPIFLLFHSRAQADSFAPAPTSLSLKPRPALLPHRGSHRSPIDLTCCFVLPSNPFTSPAMQRGNWPPVPTLALWKSKTNLPFLAGVAALNLCH